MSQNITIMQEKAIHLLLTGTTVAAAARELGVDRTTIYAWRKTSPSFAVALTSARLLQSEIIADSLQDLASTAIDTLRDILAAPNAPPAVRLRAAQVVLNSCANPFRPAEPRGRIGQLTPIPEISTHFDTSIEEVHPAAIPIRQSIKAGRNEACPCGSNLKFKRCCGNPVSISAAA